MLERLGTVASPAQISMLKLALSMRIYSPRIEMYAQMARERGIDEVQCSGAVADVGGTLVCDPADLETKASISFFIQVASWF
jgi:UDP-glucose:glycoprotein glucosyltransferase